MEVLMRKWRAKEVINSELFYTTLKNQGNCGRVKYMDIMMMNNHDGVITHLEPDILECEVKWALGSITMNTASGVMEFQVSYFKSWKMMLWKCCTIYASKFGKLNSGHRTGKGEFSFQSQIKAMPKNAQLPHNCMHLTH